VVSGVHTPDMCVQNLTHVGSPPLFRKKQVAVTLVPSDFPVGGLQFHTAVAIVQKVTAKLNAATACEFFRGFRSLAEGRKLVYLISRGLLTDVINKHIAPRIVKMKYNTYFGKHNYLIFY
jgi:hypothetical protein